MIVLYVSSVLLPVIPYFRQAQYLTVYSYTSFTVTLSTLFLVTVPTLFFTIILYALGTIIDYLVDQTKPDEIKPSFMKDDMDDVDGINSMEEDDAHLEIVPIPEMR